jgi:hypothetical protein
MHPTRNVCPRLRTALTPAGPRLRCEYPGNVSLGLGLHTQTKSMTDLVLVGGPLLCGLLDGV